MGKKLYMDCSSGISGDMTVAALLNLGADEEILRQVLDSIPAEEFQIKISRVKKAGLACMDFDVKLDAAYENHDHDMEYLYGHEHIHRKEHVHEHGTEGHVHSTENHVHSTENHVHSTENHVHSTENHVHRRLQDVLDIIEKTDMTEGAKEIANRTFRILAEAEAKAHGHSVEEVHFHEVGAIDSIVDVVSAAVCFDNLGITDVIVPEVCEGKGTVRCAHGILPVPVPAVANIMETYKIPVRFTDVRGELVTPTGAAILAAVMTSDRIEGQIRIENTGIGAGKRTYERPSILRMMLIEEKSSGDATERESLRDQIYKLETNVDDCTGEALGYVMEKLFEAGARDVHYIPVFMKKNRPGIQLNVICEREDIEKMEHILFTETTTIGIRRMPYERSVLPRREETVLTKFGEVQIKVCEIGMETRYYPEYESMVKISREQNISYQNVYQEVLCAISQCMKDSR